MLLQRCGINVQVVVELVGSYEACNKGCSQFELPLFVAKQKVFIIKLTLTDSACRIHAEKKKCGRGPASEWIISHSELSRVRNEGLLPELRV